VNVLVVLGTRPEVIKLAPVVHALRGRPGIGVAVCCTNQHIELVQPMLEVFGLKPDHELALMVPNQTLFHITEKALAGLAGVIEAERPDWLLVQGDTTSAFVGALAGFYTRTRVGHVEAGLRTGDKWSPFPEEMNRRLIGELADLHFAPTARAREHLRAQNVPDAAIHVTGNTIVDALALVRSRAEQAVAALPYGRDGRRLLAVTVHRRESFGAPMRGMCRALRRIVQEHHDVEMLFPVHLNPVLRETVFGELSDVPRLTLVPPVDYLTMIGVLGRSHLVLTDSGGIQEEAAALGVPALVLRDKTERVEGVEAGVARLVGTDETAIVAAARELLTDPAAHARMARVSECYGDGRAAGRIVQALEGWGRP
jgi:UDP-N-acetylglucosamine 2-epimerase (non-hydrolysing)